MDLLTQRRIADNESVFRDINRTLGTGHERFGLKGDLEFICECGDASCSDRIRLSLDEYTAVRRHATRFAVTPGHEIDGAERVVSEHDRYVVVEKLGEGGRIAEKRDGSPGG